MTEHLQAGYVALFEEVARLRLELAKKAPEPTPPTSPEGWQRRSVYTDPDE